MAKMLNGSKPVPYVPPGQDDVPEDQRVAYQLRVPSYYDRAAYKRSCLAKGAVFHANSKIFATAREGIAAILLDPDDPDRIHAEGLLDTAEVADGDDDVELDDETAAALPNLEAVLRQHYEPYAQLLADRAHWMEIAPFEAARMFVDGWENIDVPFRRSLDGVPVELLDALPRVHIALVGFEIMGLMRPSELEAKNSESPSSSQSSTKTSTAAKEPPQTTSSPTPKETSTPGPSQQ